MRTFGDDSRWLVSESDRVFDDEIAYSAVCEVVHVCAADPYCRTSDSTQLEVKSDLHTCFLHLDKHFGGSHCT
jgi:hypothetical protein